MDRNKLNSIISKVVVYNFAAWSIGISALGLLRTVRGNINTLDKYGMGGVKNIKLSLETDALYDKFFGKNFLKK